MLRFSVLLLPAVAATLMIVVLGRRRSHWLATRGAWLVWPLLAVELVLLGSPIVAGVVLLVGGALYALDSCGRLPAPYGR